MPLPPDLRAQGFSFNSQLILSQVKLRTAKGLKYCDVISVCKNTSALSQFFEQSSLCNLALKTEECRLVWTLNQQTTE